MTVWPPCFSPWRWPWRWDRRRRRLGPAYVLRALGVSVLGGIGLGAACGGLAILLTGRTDDPLVETALTTVAAYGSFLLAEHVHASGVLATLTAGVLMGNIGVLRGTDQAVLSARGREIVLAFWEFAAFVVNSLVFLLIGLRVARIPFATLGWKACVLAVLLTFLGRAVTVYGLCGLLARTKVRVALSEQHVLFWGGLRGALGLALALSLPPAMPYRDSIIIAAFAVVAFSVIVQGVTMPALLARLSVVAKVQRKGL